MSDPAVVEAPDTAPPTPRAPARPDSRAAPLAAWYVYALLFASVCVVVGVMWDISWHKAIGRDTFWSPPHMAIYLGGLVAGLTCGWLALRTTFAGSAEQRGAAVRFWGFRAPLGAWVAIWGAIAMLTSAPFDDWWHNAYGLDVEILSPPHAVLALGIAAIELGALLMVLAAQNRVVAEAGAGAGVGARRGAGVGGVAGAAVGRRTAAGVAVARRRLGLLFALAAGILVLNVAIMATEYTHRVYMHGSLFYLVVCGAFPVVLVAAGRAGALRWPATATAAVYMGITMLLVWVLPLFPAEPQLGPIRREITHMAAPHFPLLLVVPALGIDLILRRFDAARRDWSLAVVLGAAFFTLTVLAHWPFADFLLSSYAENRFFGIGLDLPYWIGPESYAERGLFVPQDADAAAMRRGLFIALGLTAVSARIGLWWGSWLERVRR